MTAKSIIQKNIYLPQPVVLEERPFDDTYSIVELKTDEGTLFKMFYYVVNLETENIYYGGYENPDIVNIERIKRGHEKPIHLIK